MAESKNSRGYRIIVASLDGAESKTIAVGPLRFKLIITSLVFILISFIAAILLWGTVIFTKSQNTVLRRELMRVSEQAARVSLIEKNMVEIDRYVQYIRKALALTGDSVPPALAEFMTNDSLKSTYETSADSLDFANIPNIVPTDGWVSREFSEKEEHLGIDYAASVGTIIRSPAKGVVSSVGFDDFYGNTLNIDHENGFVTRFAHCNESIVKKGDRVNRGDTIATVGNTGKATSGPHLHYEIIRDGKPEDPRLYILKGLE